MSGLTKQGTVFKGVSHSLLDQAILSASNFLLGLVFIKFASKHEYYAYSQIIGYIALTLALQAALINTTALNLLPQKTGKNRSDAEAVYFGLQLVLSLALAIVGGFAIWLFPDMLAMEAVGVPLATSIFTMILSVWLREFLRNIQYINLRPDMCLKLDVAYVVMLLALLGVLAVTDHIRADAVLFAVSFSGLLTALPWLKWGGLKARFALQPFKQLLKEVWPLAKWSLPAGVVAWAFGNGYLLIGAKVVGPAATAEVVAAKLFMAPLGMLFLSWANIFRPKVSLALARGEGKDIDRLTKWSIVGVVAIAAFYFLALVIAYPHLESYVLGEKYQGLRADIAWWALFFCASGLSSVCNGVLLGGGRFKHSFYASAISSVVSIPVMYFMAEEFAKNGLMMGVVAGEMTYAAVLFYGMRKLLKGMLPLPKTGS